MNGPLVAVVDYGMGNLRNVARALAHVGCRPLITAASGDLAGADGVVVPGVGAFPDAARRLAETSLGEAVREYKDTGRPLLGICLGLQLFFEGSEEGQGDRGGVSVAGRGRGADLPEGFGFFPGRIVPLDPGPGLKVPHMGWNTVTWSEDFPLLRGPACPAYFYFVHSFCALPPAGVAVDGSGSGKGVGPDGESGGKGGSGGNTGRPGNGSCGSVGGDGAESLTVATCNYGRDFVAACARGNVMGTQFHPEKSGPAGLAVLENFTAMCRGES